MQGAVTRGLDAGWGGGWTQEYLLCFEGERV